MRTAVFYGPRQIRIEEWPVPEVALGEALIQVCASGICGGDLHFFAGDPDPYAKYPWVRGHEAAGIVKAVNPVKDGAEPELVIGDRVILEPLLNCGKCYPCSIGRYNCCKSLKVLGAHVQGTFAEYIAVPIQRCHKIPDAMGYAEAAMLEPYSIGMQVLLRGQVAFEDTLVVNGAGPIGLTIIDLAKRLKGCKVMATDVFPGRLEKALQMGADAIVNPLDTDVVEAVNQWTSGEGASVVVDATGSSEVFTSSIEQASHGGRVVVVGLKGLPLTMPGLPIVKKELSVVGSRNSANIYPELVALAAAGKINPGCLITHRYPFVDVEQAFAHNLDNMADVCKTVVEM